MSPYPDPRDLSPEQMDFEQLKDGITIMVGGTQRALLVAMEALDEIAVTGIESSERADKALLDIHAILRETTC